MSKLPIYDARMIQLMNYCIAQKKVTNKREFCQSIGFTPSNIYQVRPKRGSNDKTQSFRMEHFINACHKYGVSMDWFAGFTSDMKRKPSPNALQLLKQAVVAVENELKRK